MDPNPKRIHVENNPQPTSNEDMEQQSHDGSGDAQPQAPFIPVLQSPPQPYQPFPPNNDIFVAEEWVRRMRQEMQEIVPGLFLGPWASASKRSLEGLKEKGITHIVCVRHIMQRSVILPRHEGHFVYEVVDVQDDVPLIPLFIKMNAFIKSALELGGKVLVHGEVGMNWSASLVTAFVMQEYGISLKEAENFVRTRRLMVNFSDIVKFQLENYEAVYQAIHDVPRLEDEGQSKRKWGAPDGPNDDENEQFSAGMEMEE